MVAANSTGTSLHAFFAPRSIAVAGASNDENKFGHRVMQRLLSGYTGDLFPIHPNAEEVLGIPAYPNPGTLPGAVELLVALLPGRRLLPLIEAFERDQVKFLLAIPSGFGETGEDGKALQDALVHAAKARGMRVIGPNSMGMLNAAGAVNASLVPDMPPGGSGLSCVTQSGGFGISVTMYALDHHLQIAKICDLGNTADIQIVDVLDYFKDDPETTVVGLFLEAVPEDEAFGRAATELAAVKPTLLTKIGRTTAGERASLSHLGLVQASEPNYHEIAQLIPAHTGIELLQFAKGLMWQPSAQGKRVAIVTATGGIGTELADLSVEHGLDVPVLSDTVQRELGRLLPDFAAIGNPIDVTPIYSQFAEVYPDVIRILTAATDVDLILISVTDVATELDALSPAIVVALNDSRSANSVLPPKPAYVFWGSRNDALANMQILERAGIPCYRSTLETVRAASVNARQR